MSKPAKGGKKNATANQAQAAKKTYQTSSSATTTDTKQTIAQVRKLIS